MLKKNINENFAVNAEKTKEVLCFTSSNTKEPVETGEKTLFYMGIALLCLGVFLGFMLSNLVMSFLLTIFATLFFLLSFILSSKEISHVIFFITVNILSAAAAYSYLVEIVKAGIN